MHLCIDDQKTQNPNLSRNKNGNLQMDILQKQNLGPNFPTMFWRIPYYYSHM